MTYIYKVYTAISLALLLLLSGCYAEPAGLARHLNNGERTLLEMNFLPGSSAGEFQTSLVNELA
jgi:PBP1b-binding outer membrane lipoprotein LpoB